jgi:sec-independent protein translocase protein TatC
MDENKSTEASRYAAGRMSLTEHLAELRKRIVVSLAGFLIAFTAAFIYSERIFEFIVMPMKRYPVLARSYPFFTFVENRSAPSLVFLAPTEAFWMHIKISMVAGLVASLPLLLIELWRFVAPGLLEKERRYAVSFVAAGTTLFLLGAAFCFFVILPFALRFLLTYKTASLVPLISIGSYADFCLKFILAFGLVFELPVAIVLLTRMGVVSPKALAAKRKYAVLLAFVAAAFLTPTPDAFNQILMAFPIMFLFEAGILAARLIGGRKKADG